MKKPSNKAKAIYLIWGLIHLVLLLTYTEGSGRNNFYPFFNKRYIYTRGKEFIERELSFSKTEYYDITEFIFYMLAPILIYYIFALLKTKDEADK